MQQVMNTDIIHTIWSIWLERNARYFNNQYKSMATLFHSIIAEVQLSFDMDIVKGSSAMTDYKISRLFGIPFKASRIVQVHQTSWVPPPIGTVKINCDGSSIDSPSAGSIGFVIRDHNAKFLGAFTQNVGHASALEAEFCACLRAIEKAKELHFPDIIVEN